MFDASSANNVDPYYPNSWSGTSDAEAEMTDACAGHPDPEGQYHYHIMSPCLFNTDASYTTEICSDVDECNTDFSTWCLSGYSSEET